MKYIRRRACSHRIAIGCIFRLRGENVLPRSDRHSWLLGWHFVVCRDLRHLRGTSVIACLNGWSGWVSKWVMARCGEPVASQIDKVQFADLPGGEFIYDALNHTRADRFELVYFNQSLGQSCTRETSSSSWLQDSSRLQLVQQRTTIEPPTSTRKTS